MRSRGGNSWQYKFYGRYWYYWRHAFGCISYSPSFFTTGEGIDPDLNPDFVPFGTSTGSNLSNTNFNTAVSNAYGVSGIFAFSPNFPIGGWVGYANQRYIGRKDAEVWNWAVTLAVPNLGKEGNLGGILVGMKPKLTTIDSTLNNRQADPNTSSCAFRSFL